MKDFHERVAALSREGRAFAVATVVARSAPVSAHLGDRAIVFADGRMEGFVGGACSREIVRRQALECLSVRRARLVSIRPDASSGTAGNPEHVVVPMTCASEGAIDVYVEPFRAPTRLVVVGATPVASALARAAAALDYDVTRVVEPGEVADVESETARFGVGLVPLPGFGTLLAEPGDVAAVVASQGHYDEEAIEQLLNPAVPAPAYIGLVASRKRGATVRAFLQDRGVQGLDTIKSPAGLDLGGRTPSEVALSILAEIVQVLAATSGTATTAEPPRIEIRETAPATTGVDPVCGMTVTIDGARHTAELNGTTYYFCCAQCRARFVKDPHPFLPARA